MIPTVPNLKMTVHEVEKFHDNLFKCVSGISGKLTLKEKKAIEIRIQRINRVAKRIIANNGSKNPILGY